MSTPTPSTAQGVQPANKRLGAPLAYQWDGEAMRPLRRFAKEADRQFVIGETYTLEELQESLHSSPLATKEPASEDRMRASSAVLSSQARGTGSRRRIKGSLTPLSVALSAGALV